MHSVTQELITEMEKWVKELDAHDLREQIAHLPLDTLASFIEVCGRAKHSETITLETIRSLNTLAQLERAGSGLNTAQATYLLNHANELQPKLSPLFVGMRREVFNHLLVSASKEQLATLKHESVTEPVQHHLTLLCHELTTELAYVDKAVDAFEQKLDSMDLARLNWADIVANLDEIGALASRVNDIQSKCKPAIILAWNNSRVDLIDKLSKLREQAQRYRKLVIGYPAKEEIPSSGMYEKLSEKLRGVFGPEQDDNEPAMEAMAKFSVWYLKDYCEIGLIPEVAQEQELNQAQRDALFVKVKENLDKIGLKTLGDLKARAIYSKLCLKEYISQHLDILKKC